MRPSTGEIKMLVKDMPAWMQVDFFKRHLALLKEADPYDLLSKCEGDLREAEIHLEQESKRPFQERCMAWVKACFGEAKAADMEHRNKRFLEEALELVQSTNMSKETAHQLVEYVFGRVKGETYQEVGGVMTTLAAYCGANGLDMQECAEKELKRIWNKVDKIRAKELNKPKFEGHVSKKDTTSLPLEEVYSNIRKSHTVTSRPMSLEDFEKWVKSQKEDAREGGLVDGYNKGYEKGAREHGIRSNY